MLTARGLWGLIVAGAVTLIGLTTLGVEHPVVAILGITLLVWYLVEGLLFTLRYRSTLGKIDVVREILQNGRVVSNAWSGIACTVRVTVTNRGKASWPLAIVMDRPPESRKIRGGRTEQTVEFRPNEPTVIEYELKSSGPGIYRVEGVEIRVADLAGFFYKRIFLRRPVDVLILPPLTDSEGKQRADKRFNTLPPPGIHRLRRPGSGSELLDLRDYIAGDPPKMIAWKASAKKDKLITKELESDIPVRCTLFLDTSQAMRLGPVGETPLCRFSEVASSIAQAAAANRDLVGLTLFDEAKFDVLPAARNTVHTIRLLSKLAEASAQRPDPGWQQVKPITRIAYPLAQELYPDLFDRGLNSQPWGLFWKPLLDTRYGWLAWIPVLFCLIMSLPGMLAIHYWMLGSIPRPLAGILPNYFDYISACSRIVLQVPGTNYRLINLLLFLIGSLLIMYWPITLTVIVWFIHGIRGFFSPHAPIRRKRKQLGAIFTVLDGGTPATVERYIHDDEFFSARAGKFLADHHVEVPVALYDGNGRYRFRSESKAEVLQSALLGSVSRARDNELFVVLADLTELGDDMAAVLKAVRVARSRHHHVMVIVPWPGDVPAPEPGEAMDIDPMERLRVSKLVQIALVRGYQQRYEKLQKELVRVGATVLRVTDRDPIRAILDRLDRVRGARSRR